MFDLKVLQATLEQLEVEKRIPREAIIDAIEQAMAAAYKKDYGKRGQIVRAKFNVETGDVEFYQVKVVVDETTVKPALTEAELEAVKEGTLVLDENENGDSVADERVRFNDEHHMYIDDARRIKTGVQVDEEIIFPLEVKDDFGRIAAQTAKQVIIQRIREAEKDSVMADYAGHEGEIASGVVQKVARGTVFVELGRATGVIAATEKIPGEFYKTGQRIKAFLYKVEDTPRGVVLHLSRSHPRLIKELFAIESPEIASGTVEIKSIAREAGARSKIAVISNDSNIDPIGACVGQRGIRVTTVMAELGGEKIDIVPWSEDAGEFVSNALSPAKVLGVDIDEDAHIAHVDVADDQLSLAIGKEGQNVRLAAKLTGWKIDIAGVEVPTLDTADAETSETVPKKGNKKDGSIDSTDSLQETENAQEESADENTEDTEGADGLKDAVAKAQDEDNAE